MIKRAAVCFFLLLVLMGAAGCQKVGEKEELLTQSKQNLCVAEQAAELAEKNYSLLKLKKIYIFV